MTRLTRGLLAGWLCSACMTGSAAPDLSGLWEARRRAGPDLHGPIALFRDGGGWRAEIGGQGSRCEAKDRSANCNFGANRGRLQLTLGERSAFTVAWWIQPGINGAGYATPLDFVKAAPDEWRGTVTPLEERETLYLPLTALPDGSYRTFLRNPERNLGVFLNFSRLAVQGERVTLYAQRDLKSDETVYATGAYNGDDDAITLYLPRLSGSFDFHRVQDGEASDYYSRGLPRAAYHYRAPPARADGWSVSTLEREDISREAIESFVQKIIDTPTDSVHALDVHAVLLARHGRLVLEEYFHGMSRDRLHDLRSAAKSLASTLAGAVAERNVGGFSVSTPVYAAMQPRVATGAVEPRKQAMRVEHLLTMSAGLFCDDRDENAPGNEDRMQDQQEDLDWYRYTLAVPMAAEPGKEAIYCSAEANLLGGVIATEARQPLADLFRKWVADPLEMRHYALNLQPTGEPYMGGGLQVEPRDLLKFAQLMLNNGIWNGRRLFGKAWSQRATSPLFEMRGYHYGYLWWVGEYDYHGRKVQAFFAGGNGGQVSMGVPELDLAIVFLGGNYADRVLFVPQKEYVPDFILPAVSEAGTR